MERATRVLAAQRGEPGHQVLRASRLRAVLFPGPATAIAAASSIRWLRPCRVAVPPPPPSAPKRMNKKVIEDQVVYSLPRTPSAVDHARVVHTAHVHVNSARAVCVIVHGSHPVVESPPDSRARQRAQEHYKEYPEAGQAAPTPPCCRGRRTPSCWCCPCERRTRRPAPRMHPERHATAASRCAFKTITTAAARGRGSCSARSCWLPSPAPMGTSVTHVHAPARPAAVALQQVTGPAIARRPYRARVGRIQPLCAVQPPAPFSRLPCGDARGRRCRGWFVCRWPSLKICAATTCRAAAPVKPVARSRFGGSRGRRPQAWPPRSLARLGGVERAAAAGVIPRPKPAPWFLARPLAHRGPRRPAWPHQAFRFAALAPSRWRPILIVFLKTKFSF